MPTPQQQRGELPVLPCTITCFSPLATLLAYRLFLRTASAFGLAAFSDLRIEVEEPYFRSGGGQPVNGAQAYQGCKRHLYG